MTRFDLAYDTATVSGIAASIAALNTLDALAALLTIACGVVLFAVCRHAAFVGRIKRRRT